jgi:hypothetical protein
MTIAYCGLECQTCPIRLATLEKDETRQTEMRVKIAEELAKVYGTTPKPGIITDCDGCKFIDGRLFTGCIDCEIRKCSSGRKLENCAYCSDYACDKLNRHFSIDPGARARLEEIRKSANYFNAI